MHAKICDIRISDIKVQERVRKNMGDLHALAEWIRKLGCVLHPVLITPERELVCGERTLRACRDILGWETIPARIVEVKSLLLGQIAPNLVQKSYTVAERVAIADLLRTYRHGGDRRSGQVLNGEVEPLTLDQAAKLAGFGGKDGYYRAKAMLDQGVPELVKALDDKEISISAAAELASLRPEEQRSLLATRKDWTAAEIVRIKQQAQHGAGPVLPTPTSGESDELKPECEQPVLSGFLPVNQRDVDQPVVVPSGSDDGRLDDADDETEPVPAGRDGDSYNFYPTPRYVTEALLEVEEFGSVVWEPACGDGAISKVLIEEGYEVVSSDIVDRGYGKVEDFFQSDRTAESIVTNPDYDYAEEFVRTALAKTTYKVAMLLPLTNLATHDGYVLHTSSPLKVVYVFTSMVSLYPHGRSGPKPPGFVDYAWFVWEHGYEGEPVIRFFPPNLIGRTKKKQQECPKPKHPARKGG